MDSLSQLNVDQLVISIANDLVGPMKSAILVFCYIAAVVMAMVSILLMVKRSQDPMRGPGVGAIAMALLLAAVLMGIGNSMQHFAGSFFGGAGRAQMAALSYSTGNSTLDTQATNVIVAMLGIGEVVGYIAFIRGWFILNACANGKPDASQGKGFIFIVGGFFAVYAGNLLDHLQNSLHINIVNFS